MIWYFHGIIAPLDRTFSVPAIVGEARSLWPGKCPEPADLYSGTERILSQTQLGAKPGDPSNIGLKDTKVKKIMGVLRAAGSVLTSVVLTMDLLLLCRTFGVHLNSESKLCSSLEV
jgi:hypothetical protein